MTMTTPDSQFPLLVLAGIHEGLAYYFYADRGGFYVRCSPIDSATPIWQILRTRVHLTRPGHVLDDLGEMYRAHPRSIIDLMFRVPSDDRRDTHEHPLEIRVHRMADAFRYTDE